MPIESPRKMHRTTEKKLAPVNAATNGKSFGNTNVYAEVRGKYARHPVINHRPLSCKNTHQNFFNENSASPDKHVSVLDRRRSLRRSSLSPGSPETDQNIGELTRLLKIERLKRLIIKKKFELQDHFK